MHRRPCIFHSITFLVSTYSITVITSHNHHDTHTKKNCQKKLSASSSKRSHYEVCMFLTSTLLFKYHCQPSAIWSISESLVKNNSWTWEIWTWETILRTRDWNFTTFGWLEANGNERIHAAVKVGYKEWVNLVERLCDCWQWGPLSAICHSFLVVV